MRSREVRAGDSNEESDNGLHRYLTLLYVQTSYPSIDSSFTVTGDRKILPSIPEAWSPATSYHYYRKKFVKSVRYNALVQVRRGRKWESSK
jgi:hypothetical protein